MVWSTVIPIVGLVVWSVLTIATWLPLRRRVATMSAHDARRSAVRWGMFVGFGVTAVLVLGLALGFAPGNAPQFGMAIFIALAVIVGVASGLMLGWAAYEQRPRK